MGKKFLCQKNFVSKIFLGQKNVGSKKCFRSKIFLGISDGVHGKTWEIFPASFDPPMSLGTFRDTYGVWSPFRYLFFYYELGNFVNILDPPPLLWKFPKWNFGIVWFLGAKAPLYLATLIHSFIHSFTKKFEICINLLSHAFIVGDGQRWS